MAEQTAAVLLIAAMSAGLWLSLNREAWASFSGWIREVYENSYVYQYFNPDTGEVLGDYEITGLPEGYERIIVDQGENICIKMYQWEDGGCMLSYWKNNDDVRGAIDMLGGCILETVHVNDFEADLYSYQDGSHPSELIWINTRENVSFQISAMGDKAFLIKLAESVK